MRPSRLVTLSAIVVIATGCAGTAVTPAPSAAPTTAASAAAPSPSAQSPSAQKKLTLLWSLPDLQQPFFVHMQKSLRAEAEAIGGITLIETDGQNKAEKQTLDVEAAVTKKVDGIIISPIDSVAMAPAIQAAVNAGIPVVTIDRRVDGVTGILAHVGADNVIGGEAQGQLIIKTFPAGATIVNLQGAPGASPAIDRNKGLHNVLDKLADKYKFVSEQTAKWQREDGVTVTEAILAGLAKKPDVIVAANDNMAFGALQVIQEQKLATKVIGFDALPEALKSVKDGGLLATVEQFPGGQSRGALKAMVDYLRNGTKPEASTLLSPVAITKENIDKAERLGEVK
jgi:ABC-type sugar transport system substrate-binding protein